METLPLLDDMIFHFDARGIAKRFRHAAIFGALEALGDGETMRFVNDHDPLPLLGQIRQRYGSQVAIDYIARDPGRIVIDFLIRPHAQQTDNATTAAQGGCGGGGGCSCT